ncbi:MULTISPECIES: siderophore-interacting protein [Streptomyces]|uniref:siderophore-interacting protein n=1 Tax=Streptomyces TaxID=1883 RepID=UPI000F76AECD|nr:MULTISPECIES: siderophore-interacting protein [Streptomyces]RST04071.1 siderophore-interacting protein [Streptomyces sp. WAC07149]GLX22203.1 siderophore-interacting protein [Streptomyces lavendulae subsp. lavendulae]GLX26752.1 siderophore-interacting protein [Streptomyces lavendulae subsp. lavendulae]
MAVGKGWEGVVLKLLRGKDFTFTVTGVEEVTEHFRRVRFSDGGLLAAAGASLHPTMWVRVWFQGGSRPHQRAYTLVDPDPAAGTFAFEFALHDGLASRWARTAAPGDTLEATVQGTGFTAPDPEPERLLVIGDPASLPAVNSLLDAYPRTPATIWFETQHDSDAELPVRADPDRHDVRRVARDGSALARRVRAELPQLLGPDPAAAYVWLACDTATTRDLAGYLKKELGLPKQRVNSLGYWRAA